MFIPKQQIQESGVNFLEVLRSIPPAELLRKQRAIARIAPRLQYSVVSECGSCFVIFCDRALVHVKCILMVY